VHTHNDTHCSFVYIDRYTHTAETHMSECGIFLRYIFLFCFTLRKVWTVVGLLVRWQNECTNCVDTIPNTLFCHETVAAVQLWVRVWVCVCVCICVSWTFQRRNSLCHMQISLHYLSVWLSDSLSIYLSVCRPAWQLMTIVSRKSCRFFLRFLYFILFLFILFCIFYLWLYLCALEIPFGLSKCLFYK